MLTSQRRKQVTGKITSYASANTVHISCLRNSDTHAQTMSMDHLGALSQAELLDARILTVVACRCQT
jgi:hypothetical protein